MRDPMSKSDILEGFFKIAQEKGLISEDAPEKAKKILEKNPRADSLSMEDIAKLYKTKPNAPKGSQYKRNIYEVAHPAPVFIAPSYDKINGLVENENERQDITINKLFEFPLNDGNVTQHKLAERELMLSLVRVANDLDNKNEDQLRSLADACLFQVSTTPLKKQGLTLLGAGLVAIPALLGALYVQQHMSFINEGFDNNNEKLVAEVDDLLSSSSSWGVGYDYKAGFKTQVQDFKNKLESFNNLYKKVEPIITNLETPKTAQDLLKITGQPQSDSVIKAYNAIKSAADNMLPYIRDIERNFASETYKAKQISDKGILSSLVDKTQILHGGKGLIADDFDDVVRAIGPYKKSIADLLQMLKQAESVEKSAQQRLQEAAAESGGQTETEKTETSTPVTKDIDQEQAEKLENDLSGGLF
jgi:hypothetical protein